MVLGTGYECEKDQKLKEPRFVPRPERSFHKKPLILLLLDVSWRPDAAELAAGHDDQPRAEDLALFHRV